MGKDSKMNNEPVAYVNSMCNDYIDWKADPMSIDGQPLYTHPVKELTASPPHIVDSGASVKTLADYIEQETREEMLRQQMQLLFEEINNLQKENAKLKRDVEGLMDGRC